MEEKEILYNQDQITALCRVFFKFSRKKIIRALKCQGAVDKVDARKIRKVALEMGMREVGVEKVTVLR